MIINVVMIDLFLDP